MIQNIWSGVSNKNGFKSFLWYIIFALIDDSSTSLKMMERFFEMVEGMNFIIYKAIDGLDALIQIKDKLNTIDVIFTDNIMPNIDGPLFTRIIRGLNYKNLIFGLTGNGLQNDIDYFLKNGADHIFVKPFNIEKFTSFINFIRKTPSFESLTSSSLKLTMHENMLYWKSLTNDNEIEKTQFNI